MVHIFITKEEERVLGIQEQVTTSWRRQDNIPGSDGFEKISDKHNRKTQARGTRVDSMRASTATSHGVA